MSALPLGILVSGTGTNLKAILDAIADNRLNATIQVVISNKADAQALKRAEEASIPAVCIPHKEYATREAFDDAVVAELRARGVEWVVLAGFMRLITRTLLDAFKDRILNIHPSLLPAFPGVDAQRQDFEFGVKFTGCTVHLVDEGTDTGPVLLQAVVPVRASDDLETLRLRILEQEHALLVEALSAIAAGRLEMIPAGEGRRRRAHLRLS